MIHFQWDALWYSCGQSRCGGVFWTAYWRNNSKDETGLASLPLPIMSPRDQTPMWIRGTTQLSVTQMIPRDEIPRAFILLYYTISALMEWQTKTLGLNERVVQENSFCLWFGCVQSCCEVTTKTLLFKLPCHLLLLSLDCKLGRCWHTVYQYQL